MGWTPRGPSGASWALAVGAGLVGNQSRGQESGECGLIEEGELVRRLAGPCRGWGALAS